MTQQAYVIDQLLSRLRTAWRKLNVSAEDYSRELRLQRRRTIHFNTLRKLEDQDWSPSVSTIRDLEDVLLRKPLNTRHLKPKRQHRPRSSTSHGHSIPTVPQAL